MSSVWEEFRGVNEGFVLELYERFLSNPDSVDAATREWFRRSPPAGRDGPDRAAEGPERRDGSDPAVIVGAVNLAQSIRRYGHLAARIDPLGGRSLGDPALRPDTHGLNEAILRSLPPVMIASPAVTGAASMWDVVERLRTIYCSTIGYDVAHIFVPEQRRWLRAAIESGRFRAPADPINPVAILQRLTEVEAFETFLHRTFPGQTRFSIQGLDTLVPILDEVIAEAAEAGLHRGVIGMAHRGRLNVLAHVLGTPYRHLLAGFKNAGRAAGDIGAREWSGDVKYHLGASRALGDGREVAFLVSMPPNPSHLEAINPVVEGMARAAGTQASDPGVPAFDPDAVLPIVIHGDMAFPGQGVVAETLNLHRLEGYRTGGTLHIIANNQIGFTAEPAESYSTLYASGLARGFKIPIFHVNADDPAACVEVARLAFAYRQAFKQDVLIDLVGYRRFGHNEGDEPSFTQPAMYAKIGVHPTVRQQWAATLDSRGLIEPGRADAMLQAHLDRLRGILEEVDAQDRLEAARVFVAPAAATRVKTGVPLDQLRAMDEALLALPDGFTAHRKLARARAKRRAMFESVDERTIDWAAAEDLAFASILHDGVPIRLTGEDVERGTFNQRHAVFHDATDGHPYTPLQHLPQARASFEIHNSPLTENAVVGFEYGYSVEAPDRLVLWEAQYGDFVNGAQVVLDEFVVSGRAKWRQPSSLVLLLPHGLEGQGPDHASARPERFLQLVADANLRVANCTTAAQYFHLLRRQAALLRADPLPLVLLTPKSLLRHPLVASTPRELAEGAWQPLIDDAAARQRPRDVRRLIFCSGKIAIDLLSSPRRAEATTVALCRVEQLVPFPEQDIVTVLGGYAELDEVLWVQEEPENMGAWDFVRPQLAAVVGARQVGLLARPRSASSAEGSAASHAQHQEQLINQALGVLSSALSDRS